jgi:hypothetical protein
MTPQPVTQRDLTCARCGTVFICNAGDHGRCWCAAEPYRLPMPASADEDCLCPTCLRAKAMQLAAEVRL